jgi:tRNA nucleotidyltransferase (CCA-adding enzyme)
VSAALTAQLPPERRARLDQIRQTAAGLGLPTYLAGGFVRDLLLGQAPGDFDLAVEPAGATSAAAAGARLARALSTAFGGEVTVHAAFGTATWYDPQGSPVDCATTRTETYAHPGALPTVAVTGSILDDLGRRDFAINAMAVRVDGDEFGTLLDPYRGATDLVSRCVRVLHPRSFVDDPTRLYRAVRYAQRLDFALAGDTLELVEPALMCVDTLSGERLRHEFELVFQERRTAETLERLEELGLLRAAHPALRWSPVENRSAMALRELPVERWRVNPLLASQAAYFALLLRSAGTERIGLALERLAVTRDVFVAVTAALALKVSHWPAAPRPSEVVAQLDRLTEAAVVAAYGLHESIRPVLDLYLHEWRHVRSELTGDDLQAMGLRPGPDFKNLLWRLRAARLDGNVTSRSEEVTLVQTESEAQ